jgi:hypothetical protein
MELKKEQKKTYISISFQRVRDLGISRIVMLTAIIISVLSILLSFVLPELAGWYQFIIDKTFWGDPDRYYLTGLGTYICKDTLTCTNNIAFIGFFGGILILVGSAVSLVAILRNSKIFTIIGGIVIFVGPLLLIFEILTGIDYLNDLLANYHGLMYDSIVNSFYGRNINATYAYTPISWGLGDGFFIAIVGGTLGLISSILTIITIILKKRK